MANYNLVRVFVEKLYTEVREAKLLLLDILHHMMEYTDLRKDVLNTPAMKYFTQYLHSLDEEICTGQPGASATWLWRLRVKRRPMKVVRSRCSQTTSWERKRNARPVWHLSSMP